MRRPRRPSRVNVRAAAIGLVLSAAASMPVAALAAKKPSLKLASRDTRLAAIRRAQVWAPTEIPAMNLREGPRGAGAFSPDEMIACDYVPTKLGGSTPKFDCKIADHDVVRVKYGLRKGEVEAEVATTRLLWALGFGADRVYPVQVTCRGCSEDPWKHRDPVAGSHLFEVAVVERKPAGKAIESGRTKGWAWPELDLVDPQQGGATVAQRDALKLLAVLVQHTDSKAEQQSLLCLQDRTAADGSCREPLMLLHDVGQTFGRANAFNRDAVGSLNFDAWSSTPIWKGDKECIGNLIKSNTGTLDDPAIGEAGRAFLAGLLVQLTDPQIHDLFEVAHVERRSRKPGSAEPPASVEEWVAAFKAKRDEISNRRCASPFHAAQRSSTVERSEAAPVVASAERHS